MSDKACSMLDRIIDILEGPLSRTCEAIEILKKTDYKINYDQYSNEVKKIIHSIKKTGLNNFENQLIGDNSFFRSLEEYIPLVIVKEFEDGFREMTQQLKEQIIDISAEDVLRDQTRALTIMRKCEGLLTSYKNKLQNARLGKDNPTDAAITTIKKDPDEWGDLNYIKSIYVERSYEDLFKYIDELMSLANLYTNLSFRDDIVQDTKINLSNINVKGENLDLSKSSLDVLLEVIDADIYDQLVNESEKIVSDACNFSRDFYHNIQVGNRFQKKDVEKDVEYLLIANSAKINNFVKKLKQYIPKDELNKYESSALPSIEEDLSPVNLEYHDVSEFYSDVEVDTLKMYDEFESQYNALKYENAVAPKRSLKSMIMECKLHQKLKNFKISIEDVLRKIHFVDIGMYEKFVKSNWIIVRQKKSYEIAGNTMDFITNNFVKQHVHVYGKNK